MLAPRPNCPKWREITYPIPLLWNQRQRWAYVLTPTLNCPTAPTLTDPCPLAVSPVEPRFSCINVGQRFSAAWVNLALASTPLSGSLQYREIEEHDKARKAVFEVGIPGTKRYDSARTLSGRSRRAR